MSELKFVNKGVICDGCETKNFTGPRFRCLTCEDYDLCMICHFSGKTSRDHTTKHFMKTVAPLRKDLHSEERVK